MQKKLRDNIRWEIWPRHWTGLVPYPQIFTGYHIAAGLFPDVISIHTIFLKIKKYLSTEDYYASPSLMLKKIYFDCWSSSGGEGHQEVGRDPRTHRDGLLAGGRQLLGVPKVTFSPGWTSPDLLAPPHGPSALDNLAGPLLNLFLFTGAFTVCQGAQNWKQYPMWISPSLGQLPPP